ncbi:MAG: hypothetical protein PHV30_04580 [Candidatus Margulisbacteria bacterium]|nr:hypothetical protein [Candidatus Margulisiibacteriota bacterium]
MADINTNWSVNTAKSPGLTPFDKTGEAGKPDGVFDAKDVERMSLAEIKAAQIAVDKDPVLTKPQKETIGLSLTIAAFAKDPKIIELMKEITTKSFNNPTKNLDNYGTSKMNML